MSWWWAVAIVLPVVGGYLWFVRAMDRLEPEPAWVPPVCVLVGACAVAPLAAWLETVLLGQTLGTSREGAVLLVRVLVEGGLGVGAAVLVGWTAARVSRVPGTQIDGALDGTIYVGLVALGFAVADSLALVLPRLRGQSVGTALVVQGVLLEALGRVTLASLAGLGLGLAIERPGSPLRWLWVLAGLGCQAALQGGVTWLGHALGASRGWVVVAAAVALGWFVLLARLRTREGLQVRAALASEVAGGLLSAEELETVLQGRRVGKGAAAREREARRSALVRLALVALRRSRGEASKELATLESKLRDELGRTTDASG